MSATKLDQYKGTLTPTEVAAGINVARRNAKRLAHDAALLLENGRFPSANALAILSIEESGKLEILRRIACAQGNQAEKCWREYRSHTKKNVTWLFLDLFAKGTRRLAEFDQLFDARSDHPQILEQLKQLSFYSDCLANRNWSEPMKVVDELLARRLVQIARILAGDKETTALEIELWIRHVGPHLEGNQEMADGHLRFGMLRCSGMALLHRDGNTMAQFINEGVSDGECQQP